MTTIPIVFAPPESPGYETPEAAIAASLAHPLQAKAREAGSQLSGRDFVRLWCNVEQWVLEFSGPLYLRVFASGEDVAWAVERDRPDVPDMPGPFVFEWDDGHRVEVDPAALSDTRRGAAFWQLWADESGLYVYVRRRMTLSLCPARRRDNGRPVLYAFEEV